MASIAGAVGDRNNQLGWLNAALDSDAQNSEAAAQLADVAAELEAQIAAIVEEMTPGLVAAEDGLGALSAAQLLLSWSHAGRIRSEAAFAMLSGTARSRCPPAAPTATGSTASATASSTGPCTSSPSTGCAAIRPPRPTPSGA